MSTPEFCIEQYGIAQHAIALLINATSNSTESRRLRDALAFVQSAEAAHEYPQTSSPAVVSAEPPEPSRTRPKVVAGNACLRIVPPVTVFTKREPLSDE